MKKENATMKAVKTRGTMKVPKVATKAAKWENEGDKCCNEGKLDKEKKHNVGDKYCNDGSKKGAQ